jgi:hypothetical protein
MNLIGQVARLKVQQAKADNDPVECREIFKYGMVNAAPTMLEVLGGFQPGDMVALGRIGFFLEKEAGNMLPPSSAQAMADLSVLRRMQAMANSMEAEQ